MQMCFGNLFLCCLDLFVKLVISFFCCIIGWCITVSFKYLELNVVVIRRPLIDSHFSKYTALLFEIAFTTPL
jgi:hypothetical protein